jgi:beta-1,4-mannosyltransferase
MVQLPRNRPRVWVVVLGMFGCSPRMQYHTLSLIAHGYSVSVVAQPGSEPIAPLRNNAHLDIHYVAAPPAWAAQLPSVLGLLAKALWQLAVLLWLMLVALPRPVAILLQNPPAIPTMLVCWLAMLRHRAVWVVDWHNLAYSMMQYKYAKHGWLISLSKGIERTLGRQAQAGFCVTKAMQGFLQAEFGVHAAVLYDRPPDQFHPCSMAETHDLFGRLQQQLQQGGIGQCLQQQLAAAAECSSDSKQQQATLLTVLPAGSKQPIARPTRPALVVSSTSWTPDEDFGILLEAAQQYDAAATAAAGGSKQRSSKKASSGNSGSGKSYPDVLFVITGRGPQREMYLSRIRQLQLSKVAFCSMWLEPDDYPLMLGAADLGVSLHMSSSGIDLPMKVVDMFGAGLPVCAADFKCIGELVAEGKTGLLFSSAEQLAQQLLQLLEGFDGAAGSGANGQLAQLRAGVAREQGSWRWRDNWDEVAAPVFAKIADAAEGGSSRGSTSKRKAKKLA